MNIQESNKLVAKFMGRKPQTDGISWFDENYKPIKYDDWNTLMPVVEKIWKDCDGDYAELVHKSFLDYGYDIEATYKVVVEFIKWYNDETI